MTAVAKLLPCPFCGYDMSADEDGAYQKAGFIGAQTPVWAVTCGGTGCNASVETTSVEMAVDAWNRRASPAELGGVACATCCRVDQADAWEAVFDTLQEIRPDFVPAGVTAMDASCALIRELSTPRAAEAVTEEVWRVIDDAAKLASGESFGHACDAVDWIREALAALTTPSVENGNV